MRVLAPTYPPFSHKIQDKWQGEGFKKASQILEVAKIPYQITPSSNFVQAF
ncbi:hypothetical protein [Catenovulum adriaticum]|uniref:Uncharacterized protein n=1 Tax=Catenovulum adriaticum TaxID=2984846 RepID=A0ABY7AKD0_9ALTE|nr:hypothetical protein [Catenovulum sp. TS8]WAJ69207.1 hypothetical protein OLW01_08405 [Catenovulum sp. TS8]